MYEGDVGLIPMFCVILLIWMNAPLNAAYDEGMKYLGD